MMVAVQFAISLGIKDPMFEGDNLQVINACNGKSSFGLIDLSRGDQSYVLSFNT